MTVNNNFSPILPFREHAFFSALLLKRCDDLYRGMFQVIEKQGDTKSRLHLQERAVRKWRALDNRLSELFGQPLHRYCGCDVQGKIIPLHEGASLKGRAVILYSWPLGGGHDVVQTALAERLSRCQMHVYKVNAFEDVLRKFDLLSKVSRGMVSSADLVNTLLRNRCWKILSGLNWFFDGERPETQEQKIKQFKISLRKRGNPDLAITCFDRYVGAIEKACARLNIPTLSFAADFTPEFCLDIRSPKNVENRRFVRSIMFQEDELMEDIRGVLRREQIQFGGLPVRAPFLKKYTSQELEALRLKWDVNPQERVVILLSGSAGVENSFAEYIVQKYNQNLPIHLFIICGKNEAQKRRLEEMFFHRINHSVRTRVLGWTEETQMGELEAMAAEDQRKGAVISTKGGGGSLSEAVAAGAPLLIYDGNPIQWEKKNIAFVCRNNLGISFTQENQLVDRLIELLKRPYSPKIDYRKVDSTALTIRLVKSLL